MSVTHGTVQASFYQININLGEGSYAFDFFETHLGLAKEWEDDLIMMTTARRDGACEVRVDVVPGRPDLDSTWTDVIEFSVIAGEATTIESWDTTPWFSVPDVVQGVTYRVRYSIVNGQAGHEQRFGELQIPSFESYILQFWPEANTEPAVIRCQSPWAQYFEFENEAEQLMGSLVLDPIDEVVDALLDIAIARHPDAAEEVRSGNRKFIVGFQVYLAVLERHTRHNPAFDFLRISPDNTEPLVFARLGVAD